MNEELLKQKRKIKQSLRRNRILFSRLLKELEVNLPQNFKHERRPQKSAVLALIFPDDKGELFTIIEERSQDGTPHSGQIALPGGHKEWYDFSLQKTAIRETSEELGIKNKIEILGRLSPIYIPVSNFFVQPFVGWINKQPQINLNSSEIKNYYFIPLSYIKNLENHLVEKDLIVHGELLRVKGFNYSNIFIWGATAKILAELCEHLNLIN